MLLVCNLRDNEERRSRESVVRKTRFRDHGVVVRNGEAGSEIQLDCVGRQISRGLGGGERASLTGGQPLRVALKMI